MGHVVTCRCDLIDLVHVHIRNATGGAPLSCLMLLIISFDHYLYRCIIVLYVLYGHFSLVRDYYIIIS